MLHLLKTTIIWLCPGVRTLTVAELNERLEETETNIRRFSEELVQQLALRDELDFEKEVKNSFISALIDVQNRQKEHRELLKKKKKLKGGAGALQEKTLGSVSVLFPQISTFPPWWCSEAFSSFFFSTVCCISHSIPCCFFQQTEFSWSLFQSLFLCLASFLPSASAWRDSPLSFRTASAKPLGAGAVNDRLFSTSAQPLPTVFWTENMHFVRNVIPQKHPPQNLRPSSLCLFYSIWPRSSRMRKRDILLRWRTSRSSLRVSVFIITVLELYWLRLIHSLFCICCRSVLQAMRDDSDKVPSLLTDYILKGELSSFVLIEVCDMMCCLCMHCQSCLTEAKRINDRRNFPQCVSTGGIRISNKHWTFPIGWTPAILLFHFMLFFFLLNLLQPNSFLLVFCLTPQVGATEQIICWSSICWRTQRSIILTVGSSKA